MKLTALIIDDEVPQVPKRAAFFQRALHSDLGDKARTERTRGAISSARSPCAQPTSSTFRGRNPTT